MHALFGIYEEEDPDSSNKIIYNGFYLCWKICFLTCFVLICSLMIFRLIKELRNQYVDLFKVMQFASLIFSCFIMTIYYILLFADSYLPTYLRNINQIDEACIIFFISSNQMCTGTLILHLIKYSSLHEGVNFNDIRVKIRKIERIMFMIVVAYYLVLITLCIFMLSIELINGCLYYSDVVFYEEDLPKVCAVSFYLQFTYTCMRIVAYFIFAIVEIVLFVKLRSTLLKNLNYSYKKNRKNIILLMITSLIFLLGINLLDIFKMFKDFSLYSICCDEGGEYSYSAKYLYMTYYILVYIPYFFYLYFNIKNISFKTYLFQIMTGYQIQKHFDTTSFFIRRSWIKSILTSSSENNKTSEYISSSINEKEESMEASSHSFYNHNLYKREYLTIVNQSKVLDKNYSLIETMKRSSTDKI